MPDCSLVNNINAAPPDADIVGIGALVGFASTSVIAFLTVSAAYWTDSLPDGLGFPLLWLDIRHAKGEDLTQRHTSPVRFQRIKAFQGFLAALLDTSLVMGAFVLVSGLARLDEITTYSVTILIDLGYFTACVNLTIMPVLTQELRGHRLLKSIRTFLIVLSLVLLLFFMTTQLFWQPASVQFVYYKCALQKANTIDWSHYSWLEFTFSILLMICMMLLYADGLSLLWTRTHLTWVGPLLGPWMRYHDINEKEALDYIADREVKDFSKTSHTRRNAEKWGFYHSIVSFESSIALLAFTIALGIAQVLIHRRDLGGHDLNNMGFGQILPICTLLLPVMAALKSYDEYRDALQALQQPHDPQHLHASHGSAIECEELVPESELEEDKTPVQERGAYPEPHHSFSYHAIYGHLSKHLSHRAQSRFAIVDSSLNLQRSMPLWMQGGNSESLPMSGQTFSRPSSAASSYDSLYKVPVTDRAAPAQVHRANSTSPTTYNSNVRSSHSLKKKSVRTWAWIWVSIIAIFSSLMAIFLPIGGIASLVFFFVFVLITLRGVYLPIHYFFVIWRIGKDKRTKLNGGTSVGSNTT